MTKESASSKESLMITKIISYLVLVDILSLISTCFSFRAKYLNYVRRYHSILRNDDNDCDVAIIGAGFYHYKIIQSYDI